MNWNDVYQKNKKLDLIFEEKFKNDEKMFEKNCIELIVEIAEFTNETRCFKYWSKKKIDKEDLLEELADSIMICLYFYNYLGIENIEVKNLDLVDDILVCINNLFKLSTEVLENLTKELIEKIFNYLIYIGKMLNLTEKEILEACIMKINKQEKRLESN